MSFTTRLLITLGVMGAVFFASAVPGRAQAGDSAFVWLIAATPAPLQKALHVCVYAVLTVLWAWTLDNLQSKTLRLVLPIAFAISFGALMEWYQTKVPGRIGSLLDVALNTAGAIMGLLLALSIF